MLKEIKLGDLVYIKTLPIGAGNLHIKNVGIVTRELSDVVQYVNNDTQNDTLGVKWLDIQMNLDIEKCDKNTLLAQQVFIVNTVLLLLTKL